MLSQGLNFMVIGMSVVFMFLIVMVIIMKLMYQIVKVLNKFFPEKEEELAVSGSAIGDDVEIAIVLAAIYLMRNK